jgi:hypothetical protein
MVIEPPKLDPMLTTRQRFAQHSVDPACAGCHRLMDPIGLGFERYDAAGLFRATEAGKPIDAKGEVVGSDIGVFDGPIELGRKLAGSADLRACAVRQWFRFAYGRGEVAEDACTLGKLEGAVAQAKGDVRELIVALTQTDAFLYRRAEGGAP